MLMVMQQLSEDHTCSPFVNKNRLLALVKSALRKNVLYWFIHLTVDELKCQISSPRGDYPLPPPPPISQLSNSKTNVGQYSQASPLL